MRKQLLILSLIITQPVFAGTRVCSPSLWPLQALQHESVSPQVSDTLQHLSKKLLQAPSHAIPVLESAGVTEANDPRLLASRAAFQDSDRAAVLALFYALHHDDIYLNKVKQILLDWSKVNHPTGSPIDETRLEGMIYAYDLIGCHLSSWENNQIKQWLEEMRSKKINWKFGPLTSRNNHRIHQLKMLLLLDKVLHRESHYKAVYAETEKYSSINIIKATGESIDYRERHALYYHNYTVQAWLEISLLTGCCQDSVTHAFTFLSEKLLSHHIGGEFVNSTAKIDALRGENGFTYAKKDGMFDLSKASPTIITYYTIKSETPNPRLWSIVDAAKPSPWLVFLKARRALLLPINAVGNAHDPA